MQRYTIRENIEIFIVTKNSTFRYQLLLWYTEGKRKLTSIHKVTEEHCTIPRCARGSQPRQAKRRKTVTSPQSDTSRRLLLVKYSQSAGRSAGSDSANDRHQFRFTCVSANAISDTRHGWQPSVSTASCRL